VAFEGLRAAANQEHTGVVNDDGADTNEGCGGKLAFDGVRHMLSHSDMPRGGVSRVTRESPDGNYHQMIVTVERNG
jgi:hypothetical protein